MADDEKLEVVLKADGSTRGLNLHISPDQRDELVRQLQLVELPVRYVVHESAAQTLEIIATFVVGPAIIGARALPSAAWTALGDALIALINKNQGRRVEITFGNNRKIVVENDRRAVRTLIDQIVPVVRQQMIDVQEQWDQALKDLASTAPEATPDDDPPNHSGGAGAATDDLARSVNTQRQPITPPASQKVPLSEHDGEQSSLT